MVGTAGKTLWVLMNGLEVGRLSLSDSGELAFAYSESWLAHPQTRPISFSLPLQSARHTGSTVFNYFDNLLPDNLLIRQRIQAKFDIPTSHPFDLLAAIGKDCVGALQFSATLEGGASRGVRAVPLTDEDIARILTDTESYPIGMGEPDDEFRISLAGAQDKTAFLRLGDRWCKPQGATPTTHIFKIPIGARAGRLNLRDSCENELICLEIAREYGFPVANAAIESFAGTKALVVERFDRRWSSAGDTLLRLPQEDMCQALGYSPNKKYEADGGPGIAAIAKFLMQGEQPARDRETFFRSQVLFWLLAAPDGHAKNFSVSIGRRGAYQLTPLYDIISAYPLMHAQEIHPRRLKMAMAVRGKNKHYNWQELRPRHFISTAQTIGITPHRAAELVESMLQEAPQVTARIREKVDGAIPQRVAEPILSGIGSVAERHLEEMIGRKQEIQASSPDWQPQWKPSNKQVDSEAQQAFVYEVLPHLIAQETAVRQRQSPRGPYRVESVPAGEAGVLYEVTDAATERLLFSATGKDGRITGIPIFNLKPEERAAMRAAVVPQERQYETQSEPEEELDP